MTETQASDFIRDLIETDLESGKHQRVVSRFPPEPNGYLHIGHAKSICLNFGVAQQYRGECHMRFDDSNPTTEDVEYVDSIQNDVHWLGFDWGEHLYYASDYFEQLYDYAVELIRRGKAYVCDLNEEQMREYRGTISEAGRESPGRGRSVEENLDLFARMRAGEFPDGAYVLRARIDMSAANMKMRDPPLYRIRHAHHYRQGDKWCIYPLYDFTHCLSDSIERITHSLCTLEFENNRELYDWILDQLPVPQPQPRQTEFARLNLTYTVLSKRKLLELVQGKYVSGWDDPRMPTLAGFRRRGYTPESIRNFCNRIGVAKNNSVVDLGLLEFSVREDLNQRAPRVMAVLDPLEIRLSNAAAPASIDAPYFPPDVGKEGSRAVPLSDVLYIEREDFAELPPKGFHRLALGQRVRLRHAHVIRCDEVIKDAAGKVQRLHCSIVSDADSQPVKGTIQWVSAAHAIKARVRLYDRLFSDAEPERGSDGPDYKSFLNPQSLIEVENALVEPSLATAKPGARFQFERIGFFHVDPDSSTSALVFNRIVALKDSWAKQSKKEQGHPAAPEQRRRAAAQRAASEKQARERSGSEPDTRPLSPAAQALANKHGISSEEARLICGGDALMVFFEACVQHGASASAAAKWITNELLRELKDAPLASLKFGPSELAELLTAVDRGTVSGKMAKEIFAKLLQEGGSVQHWLQQLGGSQISDTTQLEPIVQAVLSARADLAERYRAGNAGVLGALVGMVMKETGGRANPALVNEILRRSLS